jgi:hypothetical protein
MSMGDHPICDIQPRLANFSFARCWRLCGISPAIYVLLFILLFRHLEEISLMVATNLDVSFHNTDACMFPSLASRFVAV